jgi:hypothetical protein
VRHLSKLFRSKIIGFISLALIAAIAFFIFINPFQHEKFECPVGAKDSGRKVYEYSIERLCEIEKDGRFLRHGPYWRWVPKTGQVDVKSNYSFGKREGETIFWHENGKLASRGTWHNNVPTGSLTEWDNSGRKKVEVVYSDDTINKIEYYPSGQKQIEGKIRNDKSGRKFGAAEKVGVWTFWDAFGSVMATCDFADGLFSLPSTQCKYISYEFEPRGFAHPLPKIEKKTNSELVMKIASKTYQFVTPTKWVSDAEAGAREQYPIVFYPEGEKWETSPRTMHLATIFKNGSNFEKAAAFYKRILASNSPQYKEKPFKNGKQSNGLPYEIITTTYRQMKQTDAPFIFQEGEVIHEHVGLYDSDEIIIAMIMRCKNKAMLQSAQKDFIALVDSFKTFP